MPPLSYLGTCIVKIELYASIPSATLKCRPLKVKFESENVPSALTFKTS